MLKVISSPHCGRCMMVKRMLTDKGIEFEEQSWDEINEEKQDELAEIQRSFPILIDNDKVVKVEEVLR